MELDRQVMAGLRVQLVIVVLVLRGQRGLVELMPILLVQLVHKGILDQRVVPVLQAQLVLLVILVWQEQLDRQVMRVPLDQPDQLATLDHKGILDQLVQPVQLELMLILLDQLVMPVKQVLPVQLVMRVPLDLRVQPVIQVRLVHVKLVQLATLDKTQQRVRLDLLVIVVLVQPVLAKPVRLVMLVQLVILVMLALLAPLVMLVQLVMLARLVMLVRLVIQARLVRVVVYPVLVHGIGQLIHLILLTRHQQMVLL